jgi:predicted lipoprotein with Yx(FWY)xxD motif
MPKPRLVTVLAFVLAIAGITVAGCGASGSGGGLYGSGGNSPAPTNTSSGSGGAASVGTATATVNGKSVTILTNSAGMTLYYDTADTATTSACTGSCATAWPPLLSPGGLPTSTGNLSGTLSVISDANGKQVTYNGHPLYTFASDTSAGMTSGEGVSNFHVATTTLSSIGTSSGGGNSTPSPSGTGTPCYGYYCP